MFKNILVPISSEYYSKEVLEKTAFLAEKFKSRINLIYIIEEKVLNQTDKLSNGYRTPDEIAETKKDIIREQKLAADNIVFEDAKFFFKKRNITFKEKICEGEFSNVIKKETKRKDYNLILMGFEKECFLNYRLFNDIDIPIWIQTKNEGKSILSVCSNLAPNQKVPEVSIQLSNLLGWDLNMLYIVDIEDSVQVDKNGKRSDKKPERDLLFNGQKFVDDMENKGINIKLVKGSLEKVTLKAAEEINPNLIILGREQKKKGILGLPFRHLKRKLAEKCKYSLLFVN
ncbi:MAG: universal stress protein [Thermoplasmatales archaeon]|nr:MAG: universal stress protein [Thermoplasmatales archaeon]